TRPLYHHLYCAGLHCGIIPDGNRHLPDRTDWIRRIDRAPRPSIEARSGSSDVDAMFVSAGRGVPCRVRYVIANRDRAYGDSSGGRDRAHGRSFFHLAPAVEKEELVAVILIGGGARSGKSRYALEKARGIEGTRAFVATAQASDEEMTERIRRHREERGEEFTIVEEPIELGRAIARANY